MTLAEVKQIVDDLIDGCRERGERIVAVQFPPEHQGERLYRGFDVRPGNPGVVISGRRS